MSKEATPTADLMRSLSLRLASLLSTAFLTGCGPSEKSAESAVAEYEQKLQKDKEPEKAAMPRPPELVRALGLGADDQRAEILFLQAAGASAFGTYQRGLLSVQVAAQKGYKVSSLDAERTSDRQHRQFSEAIARKPAAIILDPAEDADFGSDIRDARDAGILVISLDKRVSDATSTVYCDPQSIGKAAATICLDALKRKSAEERLSEPTGRVIQLRSHEPSFWSDQVAAGFTQGLSRQSWAILVHDAPTDNDPALVAKRLQEAYRIQKQFDVIFAHTDLIAGTSSKFSSDTNVREDTLIVGANAIPGRIGGLELLRSGEIDATIARPPLVDLALRIIVKMRADSTFTPAPLYEIAPLAVTPRNHAAVSRQGSYQLPEL